VPKDITAVTLLNGQSGSWNISRHLGRLHRPINGLHDDQESIKLLKSNPTLQDQLVSMLWEDVNDFAAIARKDGRFGVLYERHFNCMEANCGSDITLPSRRRVEFRVLADIANEVRINDRLRSVELAIADPECIRNRMVALWAFVPIDVMIANNWDFHLLDEVIDLLIE
jgi:hypothetical protein